MWTPLMYAIHKHFKKICKILLDTGKCDVNAVDANAQTALHLETQSCSSTAEIAYYLVKCGADLNASDQMGMTPFLTAIQV